MGVRIAGIARRVMVVVVATFAPLSAGIAADAPATGRTVKVVRRGGVPLADAEVLLVDGARTEVLGRTGADGVLAGIPPPTSTTALVAARVAEEFDVVGATVFASPPGVTVVRRSDLVFLDVRAQDAAPGGAPLPVAWTRAYGGPPRAPGRRLIGLGAGTLPILDADVAERFHVEGVTSSRMRNPEGYDLLCAGLVPPEATDAVVMISCRPQVAVRVKATLPSGKPADAEATNCRWKGATRWIPSGSGAPSVPWFAGELIEVEVAAIDPTKSEDERWHVGTGEARLPDRPGAVDVSIALRPARDEDDAPVVADPRPPVVGVGGPTELPAGQARLVVRAVRFDGRAVTPGVVTVRRVTPGESSGPVLPVEGTLDAAGAWTSAGIAPGRYEVRLQADGVLPAVVEVTVAEGKPVPVTLKEPKGCALTVRVEREPGRPADFALVTFDGDFVDATGTTARVDGFVGADGARTFRRVAAGRRRVRATWGPREGVTEQVLAEGAAATVTVVLTERSELGR